MQFTSIFVTSSILIYHDPFPNRSLSSREALIFKVIILFYHRYVPWNLHEQIRGHFNFKGGLDIV